MPGSSALDRLEAGRARASSWSTTARGRSSVRRWSTRSRPSDGSITARQSRSCPSPRHSSGSTATASGRRSIGPASAPPRPRRASAATSCARPSDRFPAGGPETWTDEAALLEACRRPGPGRARRTRQPEGHACPDDLARAGRGARSVRAPCGPGSATTAIRSGPDVPLHAGRGRDRRRAAPVRALRWRRRAPRGRRRPARGGRPGRPRAAVPGRRPNAARDRQRRARSRGVRDRLVEARLAAGVAST